MAVNKPQPGIRKARNSVGNMSCQLVRYISMILDNKIANVAAQYPRLICADDIIKSNEALAIISITGSTDTCSRYLS